MSSSLQYLKFAMQNSFAHIEEHAASGEQMMTLERVR